MNASDKAHEKPEHKSHEKGSEKGSGAGGVFATDATEELKVLAPGAQPSVQVGPTAASGASSIPVAHGHKPKAKDEKADPRAAHGKKPDPRAPAKPGSKSPEEVVLCLVKTSAGSPPGTCKLPVGHDGSHLDDANGTEWNAPWLMEGDAEMLEPGVPTLKTYLKAGYKAEDYPRLVAGRRHHAAEQQASAPPAKRVFYRVVAEPGRPIHIRGGTTRIRVGKVLDSLGYPQAMIELLKNQGVKLEEFLK